jgi:hypothetical protein
MEEAMKSERTMMNSDVQRFSPILLARIAGVLALASIVTGAFDIGYVQNTLMVAGNAAATLHNIAAHESLFRYGFSAHLLELVINVAGEVIFFLLLRRVNAVIAGIALCCGLIGVSIEAMDLLAAYVPLKLATEASVSGVLNAEQLRAATSFAVEMQKAGLLLSWVFYGLDEMASGYLIFRSGFLPRLLGCLLSLAGACYCTHGFLSFLAPELDARIYPYILYPCAPGETLIALWVATMGLNGSKWRAWLAEPRKELSYA